MTSRGTLTIDEAKSPTIAEMAEAGMGVRECWRGCEGVCEDRDDDGGRRRYDFVSS